MLGNKNDFRLSAAEILPFYMIRFFVPRAFISFTSHKDNDYFNKIIFAIIVSYYTRFAAKRLVSRVVSSLLAEFNY